MRNMFASTLVVLCFLGLACSSGGQPTTTSQSLTASPSPTVAQLSSARLSAPCGDISDIQSEFEALRSEIDRFNDHRTNWKDVVADVEEAARRLESAIDSYEPCDQEEEEDSSDDEDRDPF